VSALEQAVGVTPEYQHTEKIATAEPSLALGDAILKWYDIAPDDSPVPLAIRALARRNLRDAAHDGTLGDLGDLGFVILHRCGESFYFLLVSTWRNENELWRVPEGQELFLVRVERGGPWDWSKDMREQDLWPEHARFMNSLVDDGLILLGGPLDNGREAFHVVDAPSEQALRTRFAEDPWAENGMLTVKNVERWTILLAPGD
jgi:uncharacterized protein YciI